MAETKRSSKKDDFGLKVEDMAGAGLHFGHKTSKINPKMQPFLYGIRNAVHIIDVEKTKEKFQEALKFIKELISQGKNLLIVGTKIQVKDLVKEVAKECGLPYVNERWLGGTFTNFDIIKKRIDYFKGLEKKRAEGGLEKYTKKEKLEIDREIKGLEVKFEGIKNMEKLPEAILVLDMKKDELPVKEAKVKGIKIIGIADTNIDPTLADYPIPANDDSASSVRYILDKVKEVVIKAKEQQAKEQLKEQQAASDKQKEA